MNDNENKLHEGEGAPEEIKNSSPESESAPEEIKIPSSEEEKNGVVEIAENVEETADCDVEIVENVEESKATDGICEGDSGDGEPDSEEIGDGESNGEENEGGNVDGEEIGGNNAPEIATKTYFKEAIAEAYELGLSQRRDKYLLSATILSSVSIILLIALFMSLAFGIIPTGSGIAGGDVEIHFAPSSSGTDSTGSNSSGEILYSTLDEFMNSVVTVVASTPIGESTGSGFVISDNGYIVTNYHVVENSDDVNVYFYSSQNTPIAAEIVGYSDIDDIAVLKVGITGLSPVTFASSALCNIGERVYAVGTPEGSDFGWSVSAGIISNKDREVKIYDKQGVLEKKMYVLQTDAALNHGNSGGPLINARGEVLGIVTLKLSDTAGMGFAIPSDGALEIINAIIKTGNADDVNSSVTSGRPLIGITGVTVMEGNWYENTEINGQPGTRVVDESYALNSPSTCFFAEQTGIYVSSLTDGLDAKNHLEPGDIITEAEGEQLYFIEQLMEIINRHNGGDKIEITFYRNGNFFTAEIELGIQK